MVDARRILREHRAKVLWRDGEPVVRCCGDGFEFESMGDFGQHVDRLLARTPRSREEAVEDTLSMHLGDPDPVVEDSFDVYADECGSIHCGCGWTGREGVDCDEWRAHLAKAKLESLETVDSVSNGKLNLVLTVDPYDEESYADVLYVCDDAHLDGVLERLRDAGFPRGNVKVQSCTLNGRVDWNI